MMWQAYEKGYRDGENSADHTWWLAITEAIDWPEGLEFGPEAVAALLRDWERGARP